MAFLVLYFIFILWNFPSLVVPLNEEGLTLLSFKGSLTEFPEESFSSWNESDQTPCSWLGVSCKEQRVVSLVLPNRGLLGTLASDLGKLSQLHHLNLRDNKLFGHLPPDFFNTKELKSLIVSGNFMTGPIPPEIGNLYSLLTLDLSKNSFNGSIPSSLVQCTRLKTLFFNENSFSGPIPGGFGTSLTSLQRLNLSSNKLDGSIPEEMGNLKDLVGTLDLSRNLFSGHIPSSLGKLPITVYINLSFNNLSGLIPQTDNFLNLGPPAFLGNPLLCGPPLKNLCSSDTSQSLITAPTINPDKSSPHDRTHFHFGVVMMIIVCILFGTFMIGLLFSCFGKKSKGITSKRVGGCNSEDASIVKKDMFCFTKDVLETLSESVEQYNFVRLDQKIDFNVDQLLTASAFLLGKSGIGIVYKVVLENGPTLVVRRLGEGGGSQRFREFQNEVEIIGKIKHPNILSLRAYCWSVDEKLLIYDYIPNGDLATAIHGKPGCFLTPLSWPTRLKIMKGIARGLAYLHEFSLKKYVHGNLKPSNILLGPNTEPQISDLGLCRLAFKSGESPSFNSDQTAAETPPQTLPYELASTTSSPSAAAALGALYRAPEASCLRKPSQKWDVYSFGVIVMEMISGKSPLVQTGSVDAETELVRMFRVRIEENKPLVDAVDPFLAHDLDMQSEIVAVLKIAISCVHRSPEKRPSMRHVCEVLARLT